MRKNISIGSKPPVYTVKWVRRRLFELLEETASFFTVTHLNERLFLSRKTGEWISLQCPELPIPANTSRNRRILLNFILGPRLGGIKQRKLAAKYEF